MKKIVLISISLVILLFGVGYFIFSKQDEPTVSLKFQKYDGEVPKYNIFDPIFPDSDLTTRVYAQNKRSFTTGVKTNLLIDNTGEIPVTDFKLNINGIDLDIDNNLENDVYILDITDFTNLDTNTLAVSDIQPEDASFKIFKKDENFDFANVEKSTSNSKVLEELDKLVKNDLENGFPGASITVIYKGDVILDNNYGMSSLYDKDGNEVENPIFVEDDTLFDIASNTKVYATTLSLMKLFYEEKLDIYEPIKTYIPEYTGDGRDQVRAYDLLTHSAGYAPEVLFFNENEAGELYSQDADKTKELLLTQVPFEYEYQSEVVYSDTDFMILGLLVERISNMSLDEYTMENIYKPLGLENTMFKPLETNPGKTCASTELDGNVSTRLTPTEFNNIRTDVINCEVHDEKTFYSMGGVAGHAGLFSNTKDMAVMSQLLLNGGYYGDVRLFDNRTVEVFTSTSVLNETYGLGFRRAGNDNPNMTFHFGPYSSNNAYGHTGWTGTMTVIDPEFDLVIVLLTNKKHTPVIYEDSQKGYFLGDTFETGKYGSVTSLIYESILKK